MKQLTLGILAHVDAGKTTLSEALLFTAGAIRKAGRVDKKDAFLDNYELERERGITIFSKQAVFSYEDLRITLLDTPGHVDFSTEMERTLQVLDAAVLLISAADGVQSHTRTLWKLLESYQVPVFLFVNKMDQPGADQEKILAGIQNQLSGNCVDFTPLVGTAATESKGAALEADMQEAMEAVAICDEELLNSFLTDGRISQGQLREKIAERKVFPCLFGSALRLQGIEALLSAIEAYAPEKTYPEAFGARVFKVTRDSQGSRLTHMKITGGTLKAKMELTCAEDKTEKVNQIRVYSGERFEAVNEAVAGSVCAVTGLLGTMAGQGLGMEKNLESPFLTPVLSYCLLLPEGTDPMAVMPKLKELEEEDPALSFTWEEELKEIHVHVMGEVQMEILKVLIRERFGLEIAFGKGRIVYKETIADTVEGVGHFEPLRHYAEVHLLLEPGEPGSGLQFEADCSEDILARNWQRLILTHLEEKQHRGVLTGSAITDMKITLVSGRAHQKHTEGGDFRKATYRAVRQGLMEAMSVLLEPYYEFRLEIPEEMTGRAMTDMEKLFADFTLTERAEGRCVLTGCAPVETMRDYQKEVYAYTRGQGNLTVRLKGYMPCHNADEVIEERHYDPEADLRNPAGSVFCSHGAGFVVPWNQVKEYMHVESCFAGDRRAIEESAFQEELEKRKEAARKREENRSASGGEYFLGTDEIDAILQQATGAGRGLEKKKEGWQRQSRSTETRQATTRVYQGQPKKEEYLLVDGYNVIFAWEELSALSKVTLDGARGRLLDILCDYQAMKGCRLIVVFDAYRLKGHPEEAYAYHNIYVVYTKEAETADRYIERFAHDNSKKYQITVATSDGLEQIIIRGEGCRLLSSRDLQADVERQKEQTRGILEEKKERQLTSVPRIDI
ncbi:TetM/TetW/TetO/TetS family tetracycline resistance ribosomal protection protein [Suilimivivens aceti]|uniref:TetM/TetW/TetO/TetS family tetracycline resistance ribosomal protection protein n=1 Tax=Suilimivivens aceti TaxID=2981774 RepID=A0ABT2T640_9FIRM|nr:TetM/TetW/TetO/TetS family tetracycline resistance ribosomal protection protein [Suilimivivens aceti]MCU6745727.1 TetM/TetW/TetO/TetS family tetracycline resistance ribosomal protection protein [Suilimivivens aceti]SCI31423.1 Tetracycline resistance protein tetM [uncultured Clostridium sp.]